MLLIILTYLLIYVYHVYNLLSRAAIGKIFSGKDGGAATVELPLNIKGRIQQLQEEQKKKSLFSLVPEIISSAVQVLALTASAYDSDIAFTSTNKRDLKMTTRKVLFFPTVRLDFIKAIKNKANVTVNDVLLAAVSGAIRRYCEKLNCPQVHNNPINRALIPVAFPRGSNEIGHASRGMRNNWSFVSAELPIGKANCIDRLQACSETMSQLKKSPVAAVQLWIQSNILPLLPTALSQTTALDLFKRHSLVFSNLPGPENTVYFAGEAVNGFQVGDYYLYLYSVFTY